MDRGDLVAVPAQKVSFASNTVYRVEPLEISGFLVFDIDTISYCRDDLSKKTLFVRKLRSAMTVTAFAQIDEYDTKTGRTESGSTFMRYMFASEAGDLYLLGF